MNDNETILLVIASLFMVGALLQQLTIVSLSKLIRELLKDKEL